METNLVYLSWIHEYAFCPRRFYLRICEGQDALNEDMIEGLISHKRVDEEKIVKRGDYIQVFSMNVMSKEHNLFGICDRVDFKVDEIDGTEIDFLKLKCNMHPIEFKHGRKRSVPDYQQQLCAQAICLEEMFHTTIGKGTIWFTNSKQSQEVELTKVLRNETFSTIDKIKKQLDANQLIPATYRKLCNKCAMFDVCDPKSDMAVRYVNRLKKRLLDSKYD